MSKLYNYSAVSKFINAYTVQGGTYLNIKEGTLGEGTSILFDLNNKLKFFVIQEVYLNEWSSGHTIRGYNKVPAKYQKIIN